MAEGRKDGITRRDFLDGVAITSAGLAAAAASPHLAGAEAKLAATFGSEPPPLPPGYDPPTVTGLPGHDDAMVRDTMRIGGPPNPPHVHSTGGGPGIHPPGRPLEGEDDYDCVIVGAGAS